MFDPQTPNPTDESLDPDQYPDSQTLNAHIYDYVRSGWQVVHRTHRTVELIKPSGDTMRRALLTPDDQDQVRTDGDPLSSGFFDGRIRAWGMLLTMLIAALGFAWVLGLFR